MRESQKWNQTTENGTDSDQRVPVPGVQGKSPEEISIGQVRGLVESALKPHCSG